ncbi:MAG: ATP-binding protein [Bacillota bacterium]
MGYDHGTQNNEEAIHIAETKPVQLRYPQLSSLPSFMLAWVENNCHDIITVLDEEGRVIFSSKSTEHLLGFHPSELAGKFWHELISADDASYIKDNFEQRFSQNQLYTMNILNSDGKYIWSECSVVKLQDPQKDEIFYLSTIADIRDKKEAEEMMIRSEKMSVAGQLAAGIAHEIRNPLTSLKGFLQLLQAGVNRKEEYYNIMIDEIEKMETITSELLFISKPLTDNKKMESILDMVHDVVVLLQPQAKMKNIHIEYSVSRHESVFCDRSQIKQVLINLVKNAIEAMEESGKIYLTSTSSDTHVEISIIDEGPGIPDEIIHKLGEPFFTTKQSGTGLGIMITKQILERHQAFLEIKAKEQVGSTFRIIFPLSNK